MFLSYIPSSPHTFRSVLLSFFHTLHCVFCGYFLYESLLNIHQETLSPFWEYDLFFNPTHKYWNKILIYFTYSKLSLFFKNTDII